MDVSIVIVNWNTCGVLRDCLSSIYRETEDLSFEVIVVDNASSDPSIEMVKSEFPRVTLITNSTNRGFAAANNQGVKISRGRYVLLLNSDTIVCDKAIERTVDYADQHREVAVVGCQVWQNQHTIQMTCRSFPSLLNVLLSSFGLLSTFKCNRFLGREEMPWWRRDSERQVDVVSGMFMLVRRDAIHDVGLMDEVYFLYFEETDWCYRFYRAGWRAVFWPGARIIHVDGGSKSTNQDEVGMSVQYQKSLLTFFKKHYGNTSYFAVRVLRVISFVLRCCCWTLVALLKWGLTKGDSSDFKKIEKCWAALKFCMFGRVPKTGPDGYLKAVREAIEVVWVIVYGLFLSMCGKEPCRAVLCYHSVKKEDIGRFEAQMAYLARKCQVAKVSQIRAAPAAARSMVVAISFDDAFADTIMNVKPFLKEHKFNAAVFVPTNNLGLPPQWKKSHTSPETDERVMGAEEIAKADRDGLEIFSHTRSHPALTEIDDTMLISELVESKRQLERIVGHEVSAISYPYGAHDLRVCSAAKSAGYKFGFTIEPQTVDYSPNDMEIGRFVVSPMDNMLKFRLKVRGIYQGVRYLRGLKNLLVRM